ncbi:MAG: hypothetical protein ABL955_11940, partial [Elusimicrobiota bacterium]
MNITRTETRRTLYPDARSTSHRRYRSVVRSRAGFLTKALTTLALASASVLPAAAQSGYIKEV